MKVLLWVCSVPLIAEFLVAPFNLWSGRTMPNFVRFSGLSETLATHVFSPLKLIGAVLLASGLAKRELGMAGAGLIGLVSGFYLVRLSGPARRHLDGLCAFGVSLILAVAVLVLQLAR